MIVTSLCPLRVNQVPWRMRNGASALTVVVKGTFDLVPGELRLADNQEDPNESENFWDDDPHRSVHAPSDLALFKPRADVVLVGKAFAAKGTQARSLMARLAVAGVDKSIEVWGDRSWAPAEGLREGPPFASMSLRYERAAYGNENPVGVRVDPHAGGALPNLQPPGARRPDAIPPIGFGPIAARWPARRALLGPKALSASAQGWDEQPLPDDIDAAFFNVAPPDQRPERIDPGARLVLENLSAQHPRLTTALPAARPRAFVDRGKGLEELTLICDTLWIDTDGGIATLTWRAQIGLAVRNEEGRVMVLLDQPSRPLTWEEIQAECAGAASAAPRRRPYVAPPEPSAVRNEDQTQAYRTAGANLSALPFVESSSQEPRPAPRPAANAAPPWLNVQPPPPPTNPGETSAIKIGGKWPFEEPAPVSKPAPPPKGSTLAIPSPSSLSASSISVPSLSAPSLGPPMGPSMGASALSSLSASTLSQPLPPPSQPLPPPPAPVPPAQVGVLSVSNLAASANLVSTPAPEAPPVVPSVPLRSKPVVEEIVDLLWFDPAAPDRARLHIPWQELIIRLDMMPPEAEPDEDPSRDPPEIKDRRHLLGVLTESDPTPLEDLDAVLAAATTPAGGLAPALVLVSGELEPALDEVEALAAALAAVAPFAMGTDKKLKDAFDQVTESLKSPWAQGSPRTAEALLARLREALPQESASKSQGAWAPTAGWLDQQIERTVVEKRAYQKRKVLGKTMLRATLAQRASALSGGVPVYLAAEVGDSLPLYGRFPVRLVAEVHLQQDAYETQPYALRALALGRVGSTGKGKPVGRAR